MSVPTDKQWARFSALCAALEPFPSDERNAILASLRVKGGEDQHVLSLVAVHFALPLEPDRIRTGERIGNFMLGALLGSGGMGVVYQAQQHIGTTTREVAVKLIHPALLLTAQDEVVERFAAEIKTLVTLEYEGIARIYDGNIYEDPTTHEHIPYIAMELVRSGQTITAYAEEHALPVPERLELFLQVCHAVRHAHEHRIVHRDLKPANILVNSDGRPFIIDFGLAQAYDTVLPPGAHLVASGTPAYMSPEQVSDAFGHVSDKSDTYALGVILYELLTGQRPYEIPPNSSFEALRQTITEVVPAPLGQHREEYRGELEMIIAKALAKHPAERLTVAVLRSRLDRYLKLTETRYPAIAADASRPFDTFLSYNHADQVVVEALAHRLQEEAGLEPFLDIWHLVPGDTWQEKLEEALDNARTCTVCIGPHGVSPWEHEEMRAALDKRVTQPGFRVVPVLLPGATMPVRGALPRFLSRHTWVDFRGSAGIHDTEAFCRLVAGIRGIAPRHIATNTSSERSGECPYRGLEVFDEAHARFFFGREAITQHLVEALRTTRFLAVLGPSGSGKSSVVRAGLLPQLRAGVLPLSTHWYYLVLKPGSHPLEELALHLARAGTHEQPLELMPSLLKSLVSDERALHWHVRLALTEQPDEARFCIIVDQFEEVFTLCQDREEREQFIHILRYATTITGGQTVVVITLRADFLTRAAEYPSLAEMLSSYQFIVSLMDDDELRQAIAAPAQLVGSQLEEGLVDVILRDVGHEPGLLPLMEHALTQLWEKRRHDNLMTLQAYSEIGGVQGALAKRADAMFDAFSPDQQQMARRILLRLTQPGEGTEDTRRRTTMTELQTRAEEQPALEQVVKTLTDAHLLVMSADQQVDLAHEALIRGWPRLRRWIDDNRATLRTHRRITEATQEWQQLHHDEGVLFRGALLVQVQEWREQHEEDLNQLERDFLDLSIALKRREEEAEAERQRRELMQAHTLAEAERQRAEVQARASRRLRWLAGLLSMVALLAVGAAMFARGQQWRAKQQARIATSRQLAAQALNYLDDQLDLALLLSLEAYRQAETVEARSSVLTGVTFSPQLTTFLHGHKRDVWHVAFSPDGTTLASGSRDNTILLWDVTTRQPLGPPLAGHKGAVLSLAFSPDGTTLASGGEDGTVILWDPKTRQPLGPPLVRDQRNVWSVAFSPDGTTLASGGEDGTVILWDPKTRQPLGPPLTEHKGAVLSLAFSSDGTVLASGGWDKAIFLWDVTTRQPLGPPLTRHKGAVSSLTFSPNGTTLASGSWDETLVLWDITTRQPLSSPLTGHTRAVASLAFSPDGTTLASSARDNTILLWDIATHQPLGPPLAGHKGAVWSVAFSPDGTTLASGAGDGTVILWDPRARHPLGSSLTGHRNALRSLAFSPDGTTLASGSRDNTILLWDVTTRQPLGPPLAGHQGAVASLAFSPNGATLASGAADKTIILWDVTARSPLGAPLSGHQQAVRSVAFSPDGTILASGSWDETLILWDVTTRQPLGSPLSGHTRAVSSLVFSPDGTILAASAEDGTIRLWNVAMRQPLGPPLTSHKETVWSVAFSPDGTTLAAGAADGTIRLWNVAMRQPLGPLLSGHHGAVWSVSFSPDGTTLASGGQDKNLLLWDVATRQPLGPPLSGHHGAVWSVSFSPDGTTLASGSEDGTGILWDVSFDSWRDRACHIANRNLTCSEWKQYVGDEPYRVTCPSLPLDVCMQGDQGF